jgi:hypothetical protein
MSVMTLVGVRATNRDIEGVASDDLVGMRSKSLPWIDERVDALDGELRACESEHVLGGDGLTQKGAGGESFPHGEVLWETILM